MIVNETWMPVKGYEGCYVVSSAGRVRSVTRTVGRIDGSSKTYVGQAMKTWESRCGYLMINLSRDGKRRHHTVHSLVASAFIGSREDGKQVNHKNGNKKDNSINNLEYVTAAENKQHAVKNGLVNVLAGESHYRSKLTSPAVSSIRERASRGETLKAIGDEFGVSAATISDVVRRKTWASVA